MGEKSERTSAPPAPASRAASDATPVFVMEYGPGPAWLAGQPLRDQPWQRHNAYLATLQEQGSLTFAGVFLEEAFTGMAFVTAADQKAAEALLAADPAIESGLFVGRVRPWHTVFRDGPG